MHFFLYLIFCTVSQSLLSNSEAMLLDLYDSAGFFMSVGGLEEVAKKKDILYGIMLLVKVMRYLTSAYELFFIIIICRFV